MLLGVVCPCHNDLCGGIAVNRIVHFVFRNSFSSKVKGCCICTFSVNAASSFSRFFYPEGRTYISDRCEINRQIKAVKPEIELKQLQKREKHKGH